MTSFRSSLLSLSVILAVIAFPTKADEKNRQDRRVRIIVVEPGCVALVWAGHPRYEWVEKAIAGQTVAKIDTPLMIAILRGNIDAFEDLITQGANVDLQAKDGCTALMWALSFAQTEIAARLIEQGSNPNLADKYGRTPLMIAAKAGLHSMVEALITAGAQVDVAATRGPLGHGIRALHSAARRDENEPILLTLIKHGASIDAVDDFGNTPLIQAVHNGYIGNVRVLLEAGADPNHQTNSGENALLVAKKMRRTEVLELLKSRM